MNDTQKETVRGIIFGVGLVIIASGAVVGVGYALRKLIVVLM
jgi:hypothetical protein